MAINTQEVSQRICKCETPEKKFVYPACSKCWKCDKCGIYGGCDGNFSEFINRIFVNNIDMREVGTFKREMIEEMKKLQKEGRL